MRNAKHTKLQGFTGKYLSFMLCFGSQQARAVHRVCVYVNFQLNFLCFILFPLSTSTIWRRMKDLIITLCTSFAHISSQGAKMTSHWVPQRSEKKSQKLTSLGQSREERPQETGKRGWPPVCAPAPHRPEHESPDIWGGPAATLALRKPGGNNIKIERKKELSEVVTLRIFSLSVQMKKMGPEICLPMASMRNHQHGSMSWI